MVILLTGERSVARRAAVQTGAGGKRRFGDQVAPSGGLWLRVRWDKACDAPFAHLCHLRDSAHDARTTLRRILPLKIHSLYGNFRTRLY